MKRLIMLVVMMALGCGTGSAPAPQVECNPDTDDCADYCASRGMIFVKESHACMPERVCNDSDGNVYLKIIEGDMTFLSADPFKICAPDSPCYEGACCTPSCKNKDCGSDGCGGTCGTLNGECGTGRVCNADGKCVCLPTMNTKCDGNTVVAVDSCGFTTLKETCEYGCTDAQCDPCPAKANCEGRECGDDKCGGTCGPLNGECKGDQDVCSDEGMCECIPKCGDHECGTDGCGGSCGPLDGSCDEGEGCISGKCKCIPQCEGKVCGPDGCGGTCGPKELEGGCEIGKCLEGQCPGLRLEEISCPPNALQEDGSPLNTACYKDLWNSDAICTFDRPESPDLCIPIRCSGVKPICTQIICSDKTSIDDIETFAVAKPEINYDVFPKVGYCGGSLYKIGICDESGCHSIDVTPEDVGATSYLMGDGYKINGSFAATRNDVPLN